MKKAKSKLICTILTLCMVIAMIPAMTLFASATPPPPESEPEKYINAAGEEVNVPEVDDANVFKIESAGSEGSPETVKWTDGKTYIVSEDVTIYGNVTVSGTVNLILMDGASLQIENSDGNGIETDEGTPATLNIFSQRDSSEITISDFLNDDDFPGISAIGSKNGFYFKNSQDIINLYGGGLSGMSTGNESGCATRGTFNQKGGAILLMASANDYGFFIAPGASLNIDGGLFIPMKVSGVYCFWNQGTINLNGGIIDVMSVYTSEYPIIENAGTINFNGGGLVAETMFEPIIINETAGALNLNGSFIYIGKNYEGDISNTIENSGTVNIADKDVGYSVFTYSVDEKSVYYPVAELDAAAKSAIISDLTAATTAVISYGISAEKTYTKAGESSPTIVRSAFFSNTINETNTFGSGSLEANTPITVKYVTSSIIEKNTGTGIIEIGGYADDNPIIVDFNNVDCEYTAGIYDGKDITLKNISADSEITLELNTEATNPFNVKVKKNDEGKSPIEAPEGYYWSKVGAPKGYLKLAPVADAVAKLSDGTNNSYFDSLAEAVEAAKTAAVAATEHLPQAITLQHDDTTGECALIDAGIFTFNDIDKSLEIDLNGHKVVAPGLLESTFADSKDFTVSEDTYVNGDCTVTATATVTVTAKDGIAKDSQFILTRKPDPKLADIKSDDFDVSWESNKLTLTAKKDLAKGDTATVKYVYTYGEYPLLKVCAGNYVTICDSSTAQTGKLYGDVYVDGKPQMLTISSGVEKLVLSNTVGGEPEIYVNKDLDLEIEWSIASSNYILEKTAKCKDGLSNYKQVVGAFKLESKEVGKDAVVSYHADATAAINTARSVNGTQKLILLDDIEFDRPVPIKNFTKTADADHSLTIDLNGHTYKMTDDSTLAFTVTTGSNVTFIGDKDKLIGKVSVNFSTPPVYVNLNSVTDKLEVSGDKSDKDIILTSIVDKKPYAVNPNKDAYLWITYKADKTYKMLATYTETDVLLAQRDYIIVDQGNGKFIVESRYDFEITESFEHIANQWRAYNGELLDENITYLVRSCDGKEEHILEVCSYDTYYGLGKTYDGYTVDHELRLAGIDAGRIDFIRVGAYSDYCYLRINGTNTYISHDGKGNVVLTNQKEASPWKVADGAIYQVEKTDKLSLFQRIINLFKKLFNKKTVSDSAEVVHYLITDGEKFSTVLAYTPADIYEHYLGNHDAEEEFWVNAEGGHFRYCPNCGYKSNVDEGEGVSNVYNVSVRNAVISNAFSWLFSDRNDYNYFVKYDVTDGVYVSTIQTRGYVSDGHGGYEYQASGDNNISSSKELDKIEISILDSKGDVTIWTYYRANGSKAFFQDAN